MKKESKFSMPIGNNKVVGSFVLDGKIIYGVQNSNGIHLVMQYDPTTEELKELQPKQPTTI